MKEKVTKQRIIDVTFELIKEKSLYQLTLNDVATKLCIKPPSLYNHLQGIDHLYTWLLEYAVEQLSKVLTQAAIGVSKEEALRRVAHAYFEFSNEFPEMMGAIENPLLSHDQVILDTKATIVDLLRKILSAYQLNDDQMIHVIRGLRSYLFGFSMLQQQSLFQLDVSVKDSFDYGLEALMTGFGLKINLIKHDK